MLPTFNKLFGKNDTAAAPPTPEAPVEGKAGVHTMPNGQIQDGPLHYTFAHSFDGEKLIVTFNAGPGHTAVTAYPTHHDPAAVPMKNEGDVWVAEFHGYKPGDEVDLHFVVENNGQQADNSNAKHTIPVQGSADPNKPARHKMPNGRINDQPVLYHLHHHFDGELLNLKVDAGEGHTAVTAYPSPHEPAAVPMTKEGEVWTAKLSGFKEGDEIEVHFTIENNGQQADNSSARHKITVPAKK